MRARTLVIAVCAAFAAVGPSVAAANERARDRFDTVVIDAGHGGDDTGAVGSRGGVEKHLVLEVARELAARLRGEGIGVVMTRDSDVFVPLEARTAIANDARGDLFVSIHANAASQGEVRGIETFFASLDATDAAAQRLANRENEAFSRESAAAAQGDPLLAILGDLMANDHMRESNDFARLAHAELGRVEPVQSRGVKQAPFVVLMGVQMPSTLVEIGFVTNRSDERYLQSAQGREEIVSALVKAVVRFGRRYDARRGVAPNDVVPAAGD